MAYTVKFYPWRRDNEGTMSGGVPFFIRREHAQMYLEWRAKKYNNDIEEYRILEAEPRKIFIDRIPPKWTFDGTYAYPDEGTHNEYGEIAP